MLKFENRPVLGNLLDGAATCASAACLVHCLVLPVVIALLPSLASSIDPGERFHTLVLMFAIPTSALALIPGWRSSGAAGPLLFGVVGVMLLALGVALGSKPVIETVVSVTGSLLLAAAHLANWKMRQAKCAAEASCEDKHGCSC